MLAPVSEALFGEGALLRVNLLAVARFGSFAAELEEATGHQVGLRREGTLAVAYDPGDYAALVRLTAFRRSAGLDAEELARVEAAVRDAYEAGRPDGARSFASVAWACRGVAP